MRIDYRALRAEVSLQQVLELLRFQPTRRQVRKLRGFCPIHDPNGKGERPCFSADLEANCFKCFGCGKGGNQLDLWRHARALPLYPAALDLCDRLHIEPPQLKSRAVRPASRRQSPDTSRSATG